MQTLKETAPHRYIDQLPEQSAVAQRYTSMPSGYRSPTMQMSPPAHWGSSLGGCGSCSGLGDASFLTDRRFILGAAGAAVGYFFVSKSSLAVAGGFVAGMLLAHAGLLTS